MINKQFSTKDARLLINADKRRKIIWNVVKTTFVIQVGKIFEQ